MTKLYLQIFQIKFKVYFLSILELKQYLFVMGKKQEEETLLEQEVIEMYENMKIMNELLDKIKKCNILCRPKRTKKI